MLEDHKSIYGQYAVVLIAFAGLYIFCCAPGLLWQDSGLIQYRVLHNDVRGYFGLALAHPLYYYLAICLKALPWGSVAYKVNLMSSVCAAAAVANLYILMGVWLKRRLPALVTAITFGLSHTFWRHACIAETYTLWTALFTTELLLILRYYHSRRVGYLYVLALVNGLALSVHLLALLSMTCYSLYLLVQCRQRRLSVRVLVICGLVWGVGALPYLLLVLEYLQKTGSVTATLTSALFGDRWRADVLNTSLSGRIVVENILYFLLNFPTLNIVLFVVGILSLCRMSGDRGLRYLLIALALLFLAFASRYTVLDRYAFFIPYYCLAAVLIGVGVHSLTRRYRQAGLRCAIIAFSLCPVAVYAVVPAVVRDLGLDLGTRGDVPYRDDCSYFLKPWKTGYHGAERFAREVLEDIEPHALIYADTTMLAPLLITQETCALRPDVTILGGAVHGPDSAHFSPDRVAQSIRTRPVYVLSDKRGYCPAFVLDTYALHREGHVWQLQVRRASRASSLTWNEGSVW